MSLYGQHCMQWKVCSPDMTVRDFHSFSLLKKVVQDSGVVVPAAVAQGVLFRRDNPSAGVSMG
jgi:hypothetical protein